MTIGPPRAKTLAEVADANGSAMNLRPAASGQRLIVHQLPRPAATTDPASVMARLTIGVPAASTVKASWFGL